MTARRRFFNALPLRCLSAGARWQFSGIRLAEDA
jgi:hypothetical protein